MAEYRYAGPGPAPDPEGELVHPGDVREYAEEPGWGPWELLGEPEVAPEPATAVSHLAVTPPELAAQGILARSPEGM
jgi:hypothetical protein